MAHLIAVNVGTPRPDGDSEGPPTGIHKSPVEGPVDLRDPGDKGTGLGSGVAGDFLGDRRHHGGTDQAVYAVAHDELAHWAAEVGRDLPPGAFGENLTITGLDVDGALVGEIWAIGDVVRLQVTGPRIPCATFARPWRRNAGSSASRCAAAPAPTCASSRRARCRLATRSSSRADPTTRSPCR